MKSIFKFVLSLAMMAAVCATAERAVAQLDDSEEARVAAEKARRRKYPGGRDERDLTVQSSLPVTTRMPEAPKAAPAPAARGDEENESND